MNEFLIPLAVILVCSLDTSNEYILERNPTNFKGAVPLHSSLNFPQNFGVSGTV